MFFHCFFLPVLFLLDVMMSWMFEMFEKNCGKNFEVLELWGKCFFVSRNPQLFFLFDKTQQNTSQQSQQSQNTSQISTTPRISTPHVSPENGRSRHRGEGTLGLALRGFGPTGGTAERGEHCRRGGRDRGRCSTSCAARGTARSVFHCRASWFPPTSSVFLCLRASCVFASKVDM